MDDLYVCILAVRFAPIRPLQLHLTPINFEVPHTEDTPMFIGREWIYREIEQVCVCTCIFHTYIHMQKKRLDEMYI